MSDERKCKTCAYKSDGINTLSLDYCYCHDMTVEPDGICSEYRGSLRTEPLEGPPDVPGPGLKIKRGHGL